ncbi:IclR family transcriptional regulator [Croceicoccus estronivorus]|uniref:uracil-DNA glycosylase family protein n=1 Tax=Croceicoccus estronivorus TaxID=1172626 RepID=UPI000836A659|nr:uracil-DNA glycosylase family protein [Croceicoccus estronivorus]OCC24934.1 IclR family transcriptional regulator [Croceicoccus estronivorus]
MTALHRDIADCRQCAAHLPHEPRPVVQFSTTARLIIVGQAPGSKVHASGIPWDDASGLRLREWTGLRREQLYDPSLVAIVPMGFCYPGKGNGGDLPPRPECAPLWHEKVSALLPDRRLTLLVGSHAQAYYLRGQDKATMTERVRNYRTYMPAFFPLPHPSWRSAIWMKKHPWFESEVLPELRKAVAGTLT